MPSQSDSTEAEVNPIPRRLWIVIPLVLIGGPFAFVYRGQLGRAIHWQLGMWCFGFLCAAGMLYTSATHLALWGLATGTIAQLIAIIWLSSRPQLTSWRPYQRWWAYLPIYAAFAISQISLADAMRTYWGEAFVVPTSGMSNTILPGDRILVEKLFFDPNDIRRQSVIVFRFSEGPWDPERILVQRVAAVAGDNIRIVDNQLIINGERVDEPYATFDERLPEINRQLQGNYIGGGEVPDGHVFLLGDNRWLSLDSRRYGFIPIENILGQARLIFWSQEYRMISPSREHPEGFEEWGMIRWNRIGNAIQ